MRIACTALPYLSIPSWLKINDDYMLEEMGFSPFPMAARLAVQRARQWAAKTGQFNIDEIEYIFDQGGEDWGKLQQRLRVDFGIEAIPRDKHKIRPLQAADWLAYEEFKDVQGQRRTRQRETFVRGRLRGSYHLLLLQVPFDPVVFHEAEIRESFCLDPAMKIPERSPQGKGLVRLKYDWRQIDRIQRRYKRLGKKLQKLTGIDVSVRRVNDDLTDNVVSTNPQVAAVQTEARTASTMVHAQRSLATALLQRMRVDSQEDQDKLRRECTDALRSEREWTEKHVTALERLVTILEASQGA